VGQEGHGHDSEKGQEKRSLPNIAPPRNEGLQAKALAGKKKEGNSNTIRAAGTEGQKGGNSHTTASRKQKLIIEGDLKGKQKKEEGWEMEENHQMCFLVWSERGKR